MTDSQQLFAEYRRNGSDTAFRELVNNSTALRVSDIADVMSNSVCHIGR